MSQNISKGVLVHVHTYQSAWGTSWSQILANIFSEARHLGTDWRNLSDEGQTLALTWFSNASLYSFSQLYAHVLQKGLMKSKYCSNICPCHGGNVILFKSRSNPCQDTDFNSLNFIGSELNWFPYQIPPPPPTPARPSWQC